MVHRRGPAARRLVRCHRTRHPDPRTGRYELVWHDRKAWWQQEQGILCQLRSVRHHGDARYLETARAGSTFYNASFVDHDDGEVFFDVQGDGTPYLVGDRADKGSHSKSGYHDMELAYFAHLYTNLLVARHPVGLHFRPLHTAGGPGPCAATDPVPQRQGAARLGNDRRPAGSRFRPGRDDRPPAAVRPAA